MLPRRLVFPLLLGGLLLVPLHAQDERGGNDNNPAGERMRALPPEPRRSPGARPTPAPAPWRRMPGSAVPVPPPTTTLPTTSPQAVPQPRATTPPRPAPAPSPTPAANAGQNAGGDAPSVIIIKPGQEDDANESESPPPPPPPQKKRGFWARLFGIGADEEADAARYRYLTRPVLEAINHAPVRGGRWKYTVVHNSGTRQGSARAFDFYHRHTKHMPNGMAYHFVVGNGTTTRDGQIEIGSRWTRQINGGHVHSDYLNNIAIGICLVGDFNRDQPTRAQYAALQELITYLRKRVGRVDRRLSIVKAHKEINPVPTDCPGSQFSYSWLHRQFDQ